MTGCALPGFKIAGVQDGYADNNIFIPAAGFLNVGQNMQDVGIFALIYSCSSENDCGGLTALLKNNGQSGIYRDSYGSYPYESRNVRAILAE